MNAKTKAIVIRRSKVSGADVLLKLFTREFGVQKFYVNGARHPKSRLGASTQLFSEGEFEVYIKPSLSNINSVNLIESHSGIVDDYDKFIYASFFMELIDQLVPPYEADEKLYDFFSAALKTFAVEDKSKHLMFKCFFVIKFLRKLGYTPVMSNCSVCSVKGIFNTFSVNSGGMVCPSCKHRISDCKIMYQNQIDFIKYSLEKPYALLPNFNLDDNMLLNIDEMLMSFIYVHIKPINFKTGDLLKTL